MYHFIANILKWFCIGIVELPKTSGGKKKKKRI